MNPRLYDCREAFANAIEALGETNPQVVVVNNDSVGSSKTDGFQVKFPERLVNVGIAEQTLIGIGAGLANTGKIPFVCSASCFLTARALEQIKVDVAYANTNVKLVGISSGMAYGQLGPTHHSIEDIAWTRAIANMTVVVPADPVETTQAVYAAAEFQGPVFLRLSRMGIPIVHPDDYRFQIGKAALMRQGGDVTIIANGVMVTRALDAARMLADAGIEARVLNMATVRPLDEQAVIAAAQETGAIITVEEHTVFGGLGGAVAEVVSQNEPVIMRIMGVPGVFAPTGDPAWLLDYFHLSADDIHRTAVALVQRKNELYGRRIHPRN
ncbi:MAG: transketolase family protein [Anaerolineae bacterium]